MHSKYWLVTWPSGQFLKSAYFHSVFPIDTVHDATRDSGEAVAAEYGAGGNQSEEMVILDPNHVST